MDTPDTPDTPKTRAKALAPPLWRAVPQSLIVPLLGLGLAVALQFYAKPWLGDYRDKILLDIGINIILAVSLNIVNGFTGQFSIGHAGFMAVGGYTAGFLMYYGSIMLWGDPSAHGAFLSWTGNPADFPLQGAHLAWNELFNLSDLFFLGALLAGGLLAALAGLLVGLPSLRLRGDYLAIVTLGFGEIVRAVLQASKEMLSDPDEIRRTGWLDLPLHLGSSTGLSNLPYYTSQFWVWTFVTLTVLTAYRVKTSSFGRAFLAIRENEIAAEAVGVPTTRYKVLAFVLAAFFAGIAGGLYAHELGISLSPGDLGFMKSFDIIIMVVLGGMGSISGAIMAAALLTILPEWLRQPTHVWPLGLAIIILLLVLRRGRLSRMIHTLAGLTVLFELLRFLSIRFGIQLADYRMILYALALIVMMILRPQGFFGVYEIWDVRRLWKAARPPAPPAEAAA